MGLPRVAISLVLGGALVACGGDDDTTPPRDGGKPPPTGCVPGEATLEDGTCQPAGVPPGSCAQGFEAKDDGCAAILPPEPCGPGLVALPGETACHEVAPCADGTWGDIPVDASTEFVDAEFAGTADGSQAAPWKTIQQGIDAAAPGAIVAVAAGSYAQDLDVSGRPVRIWGRCPGMVEIVSQDPGNAGIVILKGAGGSEVHRLAVRGVGRGIIVIGSENVVVDGVWIHDTAGHGIDVADVYGPTSVKLGHSLIESSKELGLFVQGVGATVDATVVRGVRRDAGPALAAGIAVQNSGSLRAVVGITGSVLEYSDDQGLFVEASDVTVEATLVRGTTASPTQAGAAIEEHPDPVGGRGSLVVRGSVIENNVHAGIFVLASDATVETTSIRDTAPGEFLIGRGIEAEALETSAASITVTSSVIERSSSIGIVANGANAAITSTIVRDTTPGEDEKLSGGIVMADVPDIGRLQGSVVASVVERNADVGIIARGIDATLSTTAVRDTQHIGNLSFGRGISIEDHLTTGQRAVASVSGCSVERSFDAGIIVFGSDATFEDVSVSDTQPRAVDGHFGDGLVVVADPGIPASAEIHGARIEKSARSGLSSFGATVGFGGMVLECNQLDLDGEQSGDAAFAFQDLGDNVCGCAGKSVACQVKSLNIEAPAPIQTE